MVEMDRSAMSIAVLAGGRSSEREISLASGENVVRALLEAGFGSAALLDTASDTFVSDITSGSFDAAFPALHGAGGEDGVTQGFLEFIGLPYVGSGVTASAVAADKELSKLLYARSGIPTAPGVALERDDDIDLETILAVVGPQSFVKPAVNGSSYGISFVHEPSELAAAIDLAFKYGDKVLVERRVVGTEVSVGVFGAGESLRALPVVEVCVANEGAEFYDLRVKYIDPTKVHVVPARLPQAAYAEVQRLACAAHEALGCLGFSRSDFIVGEDGPVILETNTIPGMTDTSLYPDEVRHTDDLTFPEVCAELVRLGLERAEQ